MKLERPALLARFRGPGKCETCGKWCRHRAACHVWPKGNGRIDARWNCYAAGKDANSDCPCHADEHSGNGKSREELWAMVAAREGTTVEAIIEAKDYILNLDKFGVPIRPMKISAEGRRLVQVALSAPPVQRPKRWPNRPIPSRPVRWLKVMNRGMS